MALKHPWERAATPKSLRSEIVDAIQLWHKAAVGPSPQTAVMALTRLRLRVGGKVGDDLEPKIVTYAMDLPAWPADAVLYVLDRWPNNHKFWPVWAELVEELEYLTSWRRSSLKVLERLLAECDAPVSLAPPAPNPTPEPVLEKFDWASIKSRLADEPEPVS